MTNCNDKIRRYFTKSKYDPLKFIKIIQINALILLRGKRSARLYYATRFRHTNMIFGDSKSFVWIVATIFGWAISFVVEAGIGYCETSICMPQMPQPTKASDVDRMYNNSFISDIKFTFGDKKPGQVFYAHKYVLAISSPVFNEMFYSDTEKSIKTMHIPNQDGETLAGFFSFIYKEECPKDFEKDLEVLLIIKEYKIRSFDSTCSDSFKRTTELQKACKLLDELLEMKAEALADICLSKIDLYAHEYFASEYFLNINQSTLKTLLDRDTLYCNETDIFKAVLKWADHQCSLKHLDTSGANRRMVLGDAIYSIRFLLMNQSEFATHVMPTDILQNNETVAIIKLMAGKQVPDIFGEFSKFTSQRKRIAEWQTRTTASESSSWTDYFVAFGFGYLFPLIKYFLFGAGIFFCFDVGHLKLTGRSLF